MYVDNVFEYQLGEDTVALRTQVKGYGEELLVIVRITGVCINGKWVNPYFMNPSEKLAVEEKCAFNKVHYIVMDSYSTLLSRVQALIAQFKKDSALLKGIVENIQQDYQDGYIWQEEEEEEEPVAVSKYPTLGDLIREQMRGE